MSISRCRRQRRSRHVSDRLSAQVLKEVDAACHRVRRQQGAHQLWQRVRVAIGSVLKLWEVMLRRFLSFMLIGQR